MMTEEPVPEDAVPQRRCITARSEYQEAIDMLLPMAQRELRVFDPDLSDLRLHVQAQIRQIRIEHPQFTLRHGQQHVDGFLVFASGGDTPALWYSVFGYRFFGHHVR